MHAGKQQEMLDVLAVEKHMASVIHSHRKRSAPTQSNDEAKLKASILRAAAEQVRHALSEVSKSIDQKHWDDRMSLQHCSSFQVLPSVWASPEQSQNLRFVKLVHLNKLSEDEGCMDLQ
jgi:hypothetical protein